MDYVLVYALMIFYDSVEEHFQAAAPATEISLVSHSDYQPKQVTLLINE